MHWKMRRGFFGVKKNRQDEKTWTTTKSAGCEPATATKHSTEAVVTLKASQDKYLEAQELGGTRVKTPQQEVSCQNSISGVVERSEFFRMTSLFGIQGGTPAREHFIHPHRCHHPQEIKKNGIYQALRKSIIQVLDTETKREQGKGPGSKQSWKHMCYDMRTGALARLRHRRNQAKAKEKKQQSKANAVKQSWKTPMWYT